MFLLIGGDPEDGGGGVQYSCTISILLSCENSRTTHDTIQADKLRVRLMTATAHHLVHRA